MFDIDLSEVDHLILDLGRVSGVIEPLVKVATSKALHDTEADGKVFSAVDTGNQRNSIGVDLDSDGMGGEVGPTTSYSVYQEYGTWKMPFMGPAFLRNVGPYVQALEVIGGRVLG